MAHVARDKKLRDRIRRLKGQIEAIEKTIEGGDCSKTLQLISAARGAFGGLMSEVLETHVREHVLHGSPRDREKATDELVSAMRTYVR
ncbi:MAG TPA: metal/formaldehyde-sensitive transcriptional repressor [Polyangia bacterium]|nr:metal/formaldehyde-sensitive transcriptional repressor [Polyangia bacterium]